jgi:hypothetical protein
MCDKEEFNKRMKTECIWTDFAVNTYFAFPVKMGDFALFCTFQNMILVFLYHVPFTEELNYLVCYIFHCNVLRMPVLVATRSETWGCGRSSAEILVWNPTGVMDACMLWVFCVVR